MTVPKGDEPNVETAPDGPSSGRLSCAGRDRAEDALLVMIWPERPDEWPFGARPAQRAYARVATSIATSDALTMCVSARQFKNARATLPPNIRVVEMSNDDAWMRDVGPNFVVNDGTGEVRGVDWIFRSWGGIYSPYDCGDQVARKVLDIEELDRYRAPMVAEGGALQCDGQGTLITTRQCLLNANRKVGNTDCRSNKPWSITSGSRRSSGSPGAVPSTRQMDISTISQFLPDPAWFS